MPKKSEKKNWIVKTKCVVNKEVYCENCTEEEARNNPYAYSTDEREVDQIDYEVRSVEENT